MPDTIPIYGKAQIAAEVPGPTARSRGPQGVQRRRPVLRLALAGFDMGRLGKSVSRGV